MTNYETPFFRLEGCCSTIELHPRLAMNYHAGSTASTACNGFGPVNDICSAGTAALPLNIARIRAYTDVFINATKGGDPVSLTKRCHLAGIAR